MESRLAGADRPRGGEEALGLHRGEGLAGAREAPLGSSNQQEVMRVRRGSANRRVSYPLTNLEIFLYTSYLTLDK